MYRTDPINFLASYRLCPPPPLTNRQKGLPTGVFLMYLFVAAYANINSISVAGTDESTEGHWIYSNSADRPYGTNNIQDNTEKNCLKLTSTTRVQATNCARRTNSVLFCESESKYNHFTYFKRYRI